MSDETTPSNVVAALARVMTEMGGVAKLTAAQRARRAGTQGDGERGVTYAYRGIDDIAAAAQPLFGRYGIVLVPDVQSIERIPITINGKPWENVVATVRWTVYGPGGLDDHLPPVTVVGEGRDNSDKGINKAMTTSFKNLLLRLLCIGDPRDDADNDRHETDATTGAAPAPLMPLAHAKQHLLALLDGDKDLASQVWPAAWTGPVSREQVEDYAADAIAERSSSSGVEQRPGHAHDVNADPAGDKRAGRKALNEIIDAASHAGLDHSAGELTAFASAQLGREIAKATDLTGVEVALVHDALIALAVDDLEGRQADEVR